MVETFFFQSTQLFDKTFTFKTVKKQYLKREAVLQKYVVLANIFYHIKLLRGQRGVKSYEDDTYWYQYFYQIQVLTTLIVPLYHFKRGSRK